MSGAKIDTVRFSSSGTPGRAVSKARCQGLVLDSTVHPGLDASPTPRGKLDRAEYTTHAIFFPAGITVIEYLTSLDRIGAAPVVAFPLALEGTDGSPWLSRDLVEGGTMELPEHMA